MNSMYIQTLVSGLSVGSIYALVALGFSITFTTTKTLNFGQGTLVAIGGLVGVSVLVLMSGGANLRQLPALQSTGVAGFLAGMLVAGIVLGLVGILVFVAAIKPFVGKPGLSWVVTSIGFGVILQTGGLMIWGAEPVIVPSPLGNQVIRVYGAGFRPQEFVVLIGAIIIMVVLDTVMRKSRLGKAMRAVAHDPATASLMGINVSLVMIGAFAISAGLAGAAGFMFAPITSASLFLGLNVALKGFSGAILGGLSNARGCIFGGFLLGLLESWIALWQAQWRELVIFLIIIAVLAIRPTGIFGTRLVEKV